MSGLEAIVGLVALGIAVPTVVETFLHAAKYSSRRTRSLASNSEAERIKDFASSIERGTLRSCLEVAEDLYCDTQDDSLRNSIAQHVEQLRINLLALDLAMEEMKPVRNRKARKKGAKEAIAALNKMEKIGTDFRELINVKIGSKLIPSKLELRSGQFQVIGSLATRLPHSQVEVVKADFSGANNQWGSSQYCVLEEKSFPGQRPEHAYERAKELGRRLEFTKTSEGLLQFAGFRVLSISPLANDRFQLVFPFPDNSASPRSLRDILLDPMNIPRPPIPRNFRFILPRKLADAVYNIHSHNLVHKSIRPENILLFETCLEDGTRGASYPTSIGNPYLTTWQFSRKTVESSNRGSQPGEWATALYQHPTRQAPPGLEADSRYNIGHDIYSLGICLLEIGLWTSFLTYDGDVPSLSPLLQGQKTLWKSQNAGAASLLSDAEVEQNTFATLAGSLLEFEMGEVYSRMVLKCLSCLEHGFGNVRTFGNTESKDWEDQGVSFIQEIQRELNRACTMGTGIYNRV